MRERPRGALAHAGAVAGELADALRRRQRDRGPRILLYTAPGEPRVLAPGAKGHDELLDAGERLLELAKSANSDG